MITLFGKVYEELGSDTSDLLLKTRGLVVVKRGNLFIDLLQSPVVSNILYPEGTVFLCKDGEYDTLLFEPCEDLKDFKINDYIYVKRK